MDKKKTLQEPSESSQKDTPDRLIGLRKWSPKDRLLNKRFILDAISECLLQGDALGAMEVVQIYLRTANRTKLAKEANVSQSTIEHCLQHGNPTAETIFKLLSA